MRVNPFTVSLDKYSREHSAFNMPMLRAMTDSWWSNAYKHSRHNDPWEPRIFTLEEAIMGIPNVDYAEGIPRNTSPGYPYNIGNTKKGKTAWFGDG